MDISYIYIFMSKKTVKKRGIWKAEESKQDSVSVHGVQQAEDYDKVEGDQVDRKEED